MHRNTSLVRDFLVCPADTHTKKPPGQDVLQTVQAIACCSSQASARGLPCCSAPVLAMRAVLGKAAWYTLLVCSKCRLC